MIKPLVSIGIPTYNSEKFLKQAIQSVLKQTYSNFELIITDDGSSDSTRKIIESFDDSRIKFIADIQNRGISYRLNQQIALAKGEYFARMDSDDIMLPNRIELQINYMQQNPNLDIVGTSAYIIDDDNNIIGFRPVKSIYSINQALISAVYIHPSVLGKTEWFKKYLYKEDYIGMEDYELWIRSFNNSKFGFLSTPLIFYRDPLLFKLKTYLFRQRQLRKFYLTEAKKYNSILKCSEYFIKSLFKSVIALILSKLNLDYVIIRKRNNPVSPEQKNKLDQIISSI